MSDSSPQKGSGEAGERPTSSASWLERVRRSVFPRPPATESDRDRALLTRFTFVLHLRPVRLPAATLRWTHTFGLGGSALVLFMVQAATGILLMLVYRPAPEAAYATIVTIERDVLFGPLVRGVHWWSANLLIVVVLLHLARVFLTGGYHGPRQFNWVVGCLLLVGVLAAAFTGYLLPWDQLAYWAVTVATGMLGYVPWVGDALERGLRGGAEVGADTLTTFHTLHTTVVPIALVALMGFHFWRVRRAGGVVVPADAEGGEKAMFLPDLAVREVAQGIAVVAGVVVLGALFGAPLDAAANPGMSPNPTTAPWFFVGFQELLIHLHPAAAVLVVPLVAFLALLLLPYLADDDEPGGRWFLSPTGRRTALFAALAGVLVAAAGVWLERSAGGASGWLARGLAPLLLGAAFAALVAWSARRYSRATRNEALQAVVVAFAAGFVVLTLVGAWFRGPGMALVWPWAR
ncbi:MAG: cytochrome b N-terminal domain-containing protein [Holophagales bacterium]|nr:cytochrome b N-terminal domain-containing protein [Holophagales bacterium]